MTRPLGVILAGGLARRMGGGDKALLPLGDGTMLDTVLRRLTPLLLAALVLSGYQFLTRDSITWHRDLLSGVSDTLGNYATRAEAGWRRAAEQIESWGARREGDPLPEADL